MRSRQEIQSDYDRVNGELNALMDTKAWIEASITNVFNSLDALNAEMDETPLTEDEMERTEATMGAEWARKTRRAESGYSD